MKAALTINSYDLLLWGCIVQLTGMLQFVVRTATEVEARFNSVERLLEYTKVRSNTSVLLCTTYFLVHNMLIVSEYNYLGKQESRVFCIHKL